MALSTRESEKAQRYRLSLEEARCQGRWQDLPELARKVEKHAPQRRLLALTARSEAQVAAYAQSQTATGDNPPIQYLIDPLLEASSNASDPEEEFQAQVCIAWAHWVLNEPQAIIHDLPKDLSIAITELLSPQMMRWTQVCIVKAAYLKGFAQESTESGLAALKTYSSILPYLRSFEVLSATTPQFHLWTERLLTRLCILATGKYPDVLTYDEIFCAFRLWDALWNPEPVQLTTYKNVPKVDTDYTRREIWRCSYRFLSSVLRAGLVFSRHTQSLLNAADLDDPQLAEARLQQRAELKRLEATCESLLIREVTFPKASENNQEVEEWVEEVMANWRVMCGPTWHDSELGEGGKAGLARNVLDILYRAATKTFHSTKILRFLFVIHASLAEFDLAFKAFESYIEIVNRTRDREERSGEVDEGLDDHDTVIRTAMEAVRLLCRYGNFKEAERAYEIGGNIAKWLKQQTPSAQPERPSRESPEKSAQSVLSPQTIAIAYRAIAISRAQWARWTFDATRRATLQAESIRYLREGLAHEGNSTNVETLYALGLVLAESRDIPGAIKAVKRGLTQSPDQGTFITADRTASTDEATASAYYTRERKLIPLWHLLALLLTARSEFSIAAKTCDAAFEQFGDTNALFGSDYSSAYKSEHLNEKTGAQKGFVDRMEPSEKEALLQIKFTQLSLTELVDGPEAAMDASSELLALYARLFGDPKAGQVRLSVPTTAVPPKTASTFRGSILARARSKSRRNSIAEKTSRTASISSAGKLSTTTAAPTIQVTDEGDGSHRHRHHLFHHGEHHHSLPHRSSSKMQKRSMGSLRNRQGDTTGETTSIVPQDPTRSLSVSEKHQSGESGQQSFDRIAHNMSPTPAPVGGHNQPPKQDTRLPAPFPSKYTSSGGSLEPRFPTLQERRHQISLLIEVWLYIAGMYRRAKYFDDARGAIEEAEKLVEGLESEVGQVDGSWRALGDRGWGGRKSVEELWGDVWAEQAELQLVCGQPHDALAAYEKALEHFPDHPSAVVGLSNILLDIYTQKISAEPVDPSLTAAIPRPPTQSTKQEELTPEHLNRLAARDRAYGLLSSLTKLGTGWDYAEAWFALATAYEESGQEEKARECLWWVVELQEGRPIRPWAKMGGAGGVL